MPGTVAARAGAAARAAAARAATARHAATRAATARATVVRAAATGARADLRAGPCAKKLPQAGQQYGSFHVWKIPWITSAGI